LNSTTQYGLLAHAGDSLFVPAGPGNASVTFNNGTLNVNAIRPRGILAWDEGNGSATVTTGANTVINVSGTERGGPGAYVFSGFSTATAANKLTANVASEITSSGPETTNPGNLPAGIRAISGGGAQIDVTYTGPGITTFGGNGTGITALSSGIGSITLNSSGPINTTNGSNAVGILADSSGTILRRSPGLLNDIQPINPVLRSITGAVQVNTSNNVLAQGEFGTGISATSGSGAVAVNVQAGSVMGGWQADLTSVGPTYGLQAAGIFLNSPGGSTLINNGFIGALSDRAIAGDPLVINNGTIEGFVQFTGGQHHQQWHVQSETFRRYYGERPRYASGGHSGSRPRRRQQLHQRWNAGAARSAKHCDAGPIGQLAAVSAAREPEQRNDARRPVAGPFDRRADVHQLGHDRSAKQPGRGRRARDHRRAPDRLGGQPPHRGSPPRNFHLQWRHAEARHGAQRGRPRNALRYVGRGRHVGRPARCNKHVNPQRRRRGCADRRRRHLSGAGPEPGPLRERRVFTPRQGDQLLVRGGCSRETQNRSWNAGNITGDENCITKFGAWGRVFGQQTREHFAEGARPDFDGTFAGFQAGADLLRWESTNGHSDHIGFFVAQARASGTVHGSVDGFEGALAGHVDLDATSYGGYWTHLGPSNWYIDAVVQGTHFDGTPTSIRGISTTAKGDAFAGSIEAGYPITLAPWLSFEPQVQGIWQRVWLNDAVVPFATISFDRADVFTGRAGALLRGTFGSCGCAGAVWQPYLKGNVWWGSNGFDTVYFNSFGIPTGRNGGTTLEGGGGVTGKLTRNVSVYGDASYLTSVSGESHIALKGNVGLRVTW
jgi:outer membrane autotransporter protein